MLEVILNSVESFICYDMKLEDKEEFQALFGNPDKSSLN
jgi:hypothetical protein